MNNNEMMWAGNLKKEFPDSLGSLKKHNFDFMF